MTSEKITTIKLTADKGKVLTNGEIYGRVIHLGAGDSPNNYREITVEEYEHLTAPAEEVDG